MHFDSVKQCPGWNRAGFCSDLVLFSFDVLKCLLGSVIGEWFYWWFILHDLFIQIIAAEYMLARYNEEMPKEPPWLQYMREWGPKFDYDKTAMLNNILKYLPQQIRVPLEDIISKLPDEVLGQEGPTGPKQKNNWFGDERDHL